MALVSRPRGCHDDSTWRVEGGGWRQTLRRERPEAELHSSISPAAPGGPWAAAGRRASATLCCRNSEGERRGRDELARITNIFNPLLAGAQPQDRLNPDWRRGRVQAARWDLTPPSWILYPTDLFMLHWADLLASHPGCSFCLASQLLGVFEYGRSRPRTVTKHRRSD